MWCLFLNHEFSKSEPSIQGSLKRNENKMCEITLEGMGSEGVAGGGHRRGSPEGVTGGGHRRGSPEGVIRVGHQSESPEWKIKREQLIPKYAICHEKNIYLGSEILSAASWNILELQSFINVICLIIVSSIATRGLKLACECQDSAN